MPSTPIYDFPFEQYPTDQPGISLHGGTSGTEDILAEKVEEELSRVETDFGTRLDDLEDLGLDGSESRTIGRINTGDGTNTTEFTGIPQNYRDLMVIWEGRSNGAGELDSLAIRFNGHSGVDYLSLLWRNTAAEGMSVDTTNIDFSVGRAGQVGTGSSGRSCGYFVIPNYAAAGRQRWRGSSWARGQSGGANIFLTMAGGFLNVVAPITSIRIWPSGQLWLGNPHITLIGIK